MIPIRSRRLLGALILLLLGGAALLGTGRLVAREDPLQHADAIYVLGGDWTQRWLEAADLYREGFAPHIVLSRGSLDEGERQLERRGVHIPGPAERGRSTMIASLGIPASAIEILPIEVDNTAQEAAAIVDLAAARHWRRLIVITGRPSTARAGYAMRRVFGGQVDIVMRASRHDVFTPARWWETRANFRSAFYEVPKLVAYWLGLKG